DRFPALLERREIPTTALGTNDPEPSLLRIEREPPSNRKGWQVVIRAEVEVAEEAARVHAGIGKWTASASNFRLCMVLARWGVGQSPLCVRGVRAGVARAVAPASSPP